MILEFNGGHHVKTQCIQGAPESARISQAAEHADAAERKSFHLVGGAVFDPPMRLNARPKDGRLVVPAPHFALDHWRQVGCFATCDQNGAGAGDALHRLAQPSHWKYLAASERVER